MVVEECGSGISKGGYLLTRVADRLLASSVEATPSTVRRVCQPDIIIPKVCAKYTKIASCVEVKVGVRLGNHVLVKKVVEPK